jgi:hypothetical protein
LLWIIFAPAFSDPWVMLDPEPNAFGEVTMTCIFAAGWIAALLLTLNLIR